jgi:ribosomal protein S19E (S16A)
MKKLKTTQFELSKNEIEDMILHALQSLGKVESKTQKVFHLVIKHTKTELDKFVFEIIEESE